MNDAKIRFSAKEIELAKNAQWILTKNEIIQKVCTFFGELAEQMQAEGFSKIGAESRPKISRGEQYKGLPYVVLDYPRAFGKENVFAIRTLFWWGHYLSVNLHLKGIYKEFFFPKIIQHAALLAREQFYLCVGDDEWDNEIDEKSFKKFNEIEPEYIHGHLEQKSFCKLSAKIDLDEWEQAGILLLGHFKTIRLALEI